MARPPRPATWRPWRTASSPRRPSARRAGALTPRSDFPKLDETIRCASCCDDRRRTRRRPRPRSLVRARRRPRAARRPHRRAAVPAERRSRPSFVARRRGRARRHRVRDRGLRAARRLGRRSTGWSTTATASAAATSIGTVEGPLRVGAHRRAHRAQLPLPPLGRRDAHPPLRRRRGRRANRRARSGTPARRSRAPRAREGGRAGRRRREPPRLAVRLRAREGQPPRRPHDHRGGAPGRDALAGAAPSRSSATGSSRCSEAIAAGATW